MQIAVSDFVTSKTFRSITKNAVVFLLLNLLLSLSSETDIVLPSDNLQPPVLFLSNFSNNTVYLAVFFLGTRQPLQLFHHQ